MCLIRSHIINGLLTSFCSVCTGKYLPSVYPHRPRSFVARSVRKPQSNTFPYRHRPRLITLYYLVVSWSGTTFKPCFNSKSAVTFQNCDMTTIGIAEHMSCPHCKQNG